jgi:hypothetical protein
MKANELIEVAVDYESQFLTGGCAPPARQNYYRCFSIQ